jgi:hypothetical protein
VSALADIQAAFSSALCDPERPVPTAIARAGARHPGGFDVYRNNRTSALVDALAATYPLVHRLVGEAFFRTVARAFIEREPPRSPVLLRYGAGFGDFLDRFPPAGAVPYLGDVARLEWSRLRAYHAPDAEALAIEALASLPATATPRVRLNLHPSLALHRSRWPIGSLWSALRGPDDGPDVDMTRAEDVLVVRPALDVDVRIITNGAHAFVSALARGATIEQATHRGAATCKRFDLVEQLRGLFGLGAVVAMRAPEEERS